MGYEHIHRAITEVLNMKEDIILVKEETVMCDNGHPVQYITVPEGEVVTCGYCDRKFRRI